MTSGEGALEDFEAERDVVDRRTAPRKLDLLGLDGDDLRFDFAFLDRRGLSGERAKKSEQSEAGCDDCNFHVLYLDATPREFRQLYFIVRGNDELVWRASTV